VFVLQLLWLPRCCRQHAEMVKESLRCSYALRATTPCAGKAAVREKACGHHGMAQRPGGIGKNRSPSSCRRPVHFRFGGRKLRDPGSVVGGETERSGLGGDKAGLEGSRPIGGGSGRRIRPTWGTGTRHRELGGGSYSRAIVSTLSTGEKLSNNVSTPLDPRVTDEVRTDPPLKPARQRGHAEARLTSAPRRSWVRSTARCARTVEPGSFGLRPSRKSFPMAHVGGISLRSFV
jgi:hypothetical protein